MNGNSAAREMDRAESPLPEEQGRIMEEHELMSDAESLFDDYDFIDDIRPRGGRRKAKKEEEPKVTLAKRESSPASSMATPTMETPPTTNDSALSTPLSAPIDAQVRTCYDNFFENGAIARSFVSTKLICL